MSIATILPFVPAQWFTSAGDAVLAGGQLWFYEVGTSTPKAVFADYEMSATLPNPVILNGAGKANVFLGAGGYKVVLCDTLGAVMDTVDGVFADPTSVGGGAVQTGIATFADLRSFPNPGAVVTVVVGGALAQGDGGGGLFTFDPTITTTDDGGVFIAPNFGIGRWVRSVSGIPSISWWGIKGLTTESDDGAIANAFAYCNSRNYSIIIDRENVGIRTDKVFSGSKMIFSGGFFYTGAFAPTLAFGDGATVQADPHDQIMIGVGSILYGDGQAFSPEWTSPILDDNAIQIAATSIGTKYGRMVISSPYACTGNVALLASTELDFDEGGRLDFSATANLDIPNLAYAGERQVASWTSIAIVGTVRFGANPVKPEWFGAVGDGVSEDAVAFYAAAKTGHVNLANTGDYKLGLTWGATPTPLSIKGGKITLSTGRSLGTGSLSLDSTTIVLATGSWFAGAFLHAVNSEMPETYTASVQSVTGCKTTGSALYPTFKGSPYIEDAHLDLADAPILGTDPLGRIINKSGADLSLGIASVKSLLFSAEATTPVIGTSTTLSNPLSLIYLIDNLTFTGITVTLPTPSDASDPNIVILVPYGRNATYAPTVIHPNIMWSSGYVGSAPFSTPIIMYYSREAATWYLISKL